MVVAAGVAAAAVTAAATSYSASQASDAQSDSANRAMNIQQDQFAQTQKNLQPYMGLGNQATNSLSNLTGAGGSNPLQSELLRAPTLPQPMTEAQLKQTPGYQFNLSQGLESVQNSAAARGLANSGAALKGAAGYATGLADSTYQNQFNNQQQLYQDTVTNQTNQFNRLLSLSGQGESAAAGLGTIGQQTAANIGGDVVGAGNAQAAGSIAQGNAVSGAGNNIAGTYMLSKFLNDGDEEDE